MFFNADQTAGAIGATVPTASTAGAQRHLNEQQFPGKSKLPGAEAEGGAAEAGAAGAGEAAAGAGAAEGAAGISELLPLLALA